MLLWNQEMLTLTYEFVCVCVCVYYAYTLTYGFYVKDNKNVVIDIIHRRRI